MVRFGLAALLTLLTTGCATYSWFHPTASQSDFDRDSYGCSQQAFRVAPISNQPIVLAHGYSVPAQLEVGWVCEVLRMTRLAPDIIRAILDGRQPRHLNLHAMRGRQGEVPLDWEEQRGMFGFA